MKKPFEMKEENKKEAKKNIITGVSTATGAVIGTVLEDAIEPFIANSRETPEPDIIHAVAEETATVAEAANVKNDSYEKHPNHCPADFNQPPKEEANVETVSSDTLPENDNEEAVNVIMGMPTEVMELIDMEEPAGDGAVSEEAPVIYGYPTDYEGSEHTESTPLSELTDGEEFVVVEFPEEMEVFTDADGAQTSGEEVIYIDDPEDEVDVDPYIVFDDELTETRVDGFSSGIADIGSDGMPDYVNDADIDSFMDLA